MRERKITDHLLSINLFCDEEISEAMRQAATDVAVSSVLTIKSKPEFRRRKDVVVIETCLDDTYQTPARERVDLKRLAESILRSDRRCRVVIERVWFKEYRTLSARDVNLTPEGGELDTYDEEGLEEVLRTLDQNPPKGEPK